MLPGDPSPSDGWSSERVGGIPGRSSGDPSGTGWGDSRLGGGGGGPDGSGNGNAPGPIPYLDDPPNDGFDWGIRPGAPKGHPWLLCPHGGRPIGTNYILDKNGTIHESVVCDPTQRT